MAVTLPVTTVTADELTALLNIKAPLTGIDVLQLAEDECTRAFSGAFRAPTQATWDDCIRRVAGAVVASRKRPAGGAGQLTTGEQNAPTAFPRDYTATIRATVASHTAGMA